MLEHGVGDDLGRDVQEALVEVADEHGRVLDEVHDLVEGLFGGVCLEAGLGLDGVDLAADDLCALLGGRDDLHLLERVEERLGAGDLELAVGHEPMPARRAPGREAGVLDGDDRLAEQRNEPSDRAGERDVPAAPALGARPCDAGDEIGQDTGQQLERRHGRLLDDGVDVLDALLVGLADEVGSRQALAAGKALGGLRRVSIRIEGDFCCRALRALRERLGRVGDIIDRDDDAARGRAGLHAAMGDARLVKGSFGLGDELFRGVVERAGRNLLRADFKDEFLPIHGRPPSRRPYRLRDAGRPATRCRLRPSPRRAPDRTRSMPW